jgi:hypothetical protein
LKEYAIVYLSDPKFIRFRELRLIYHIYVMGLIIILDFSPADSDGYAPGPDTRGVFLYYTQTVSGGNRCSAHLYGADWGGPKRCRTSNVILINYIYFCDCESIIIRDLKDR